MIWQPSRLLCVSVVDDLLNDLSTWIVWSKFETITGPDCISAATDTANQPSGIRADQHIFALTVISDIWCCDTVEDN